MSQVLTGVEYDPHSPKVAIIGAGWVGKSMMELFPKAFVYHPDREDKAQVEYAREIANKADVAFICVPSPNKLIDTGSSISSEGELDTSIVEECIAWCEAPLIVVRSTVNPGDCNKWFIKYQKAIVMQPEYLGETPDHPLLKSTPFIILGGHPTDRKKLIDLYTEVYNANINIREVSLKEAEVIKLTENRAIGFMVAQAQELYDVCQKAGLDYYTIRQAVFGDDPRFHLWFTMIYPSRRGFNSKCIPKDIYAWCAWAESLGYQPQITRAILKKNKEWINAQSA